MQNPDSGFGAQLLPYESVETLSSLKIHGPAFNLRVVDISQFRKLRHMTLKLDFDSVQDRLDILQFFGRLDIHLETFGFLIVGALLDNRIFLLPCLTSLRALTINGLAVIDYDESDDDDDYVANLLMEIAENLRYLREISFVDMRVDVGQALKEDGIGSEVDSYGCLVQGDGLPEEALAKAFESFEVKPKISIIRRVWLTSRWPNKTWAFI
jgi:hypothetical protein